METKQLSVSGSEIRGGTCKLFREKGAGLLDAEKMSVAQAAKLLGIGQTNLRAMIMKGVLPVIRIGSRIRLLRRDCEAFLQGHYGTLQVEAQDGNAEHPRSSTLPEEVANSRHLR